MNNKIGYNIFSKGYNLTGKIEYIEKKGFPEEILYKLDTDLEGTVEELEIEHGDKSTGILEDVPIECRELMIFIEQEVSKDELYEIILEQFSKASNFLRIRGYQVRDNYDGIMSNMLDTEGNLIGTNYDIFATIYIKEDKDIEYINNILGE